jgi:hypothetical protein
MIVEEVVNPQISFIYVDLHSLCVGLDTVTSMPACLLFNIPQNIVSDNDETRTFKGKQADYNPSLCQK